MSEPNTPAARALRKILIWMRGELDSGSHEVVLVPPSDEKHSGHKIRAVQSQNCPWYREFNQMHTSLRGVGRKRYDRPRTFIRKNQTRDTIERMITGKFHGRQAARLLEFIETKRSEHRKKSRSRSAAAIDDFDYAAIGILF